MRSPKQLIPLAAFILLTNVLVGQRLDYPPKALKESTVVFLTYDMHSEADYLPNSLRALNKARNAQARNANEKLTKAAKKYPYKYVIMSRSEYIENVHTIPYRFVMDCDFMIISQAAIPLKPSAVVTTGPVMKYTSNVYFIDRELERTRMVHTIPVSNPYAYKNIIALVIKRLEQAEKAPDWK